MQDVLFKDLKTTHPGLSVHSQLHPRILSHGATHGGQSSDTGNKTLSEFRDEEQKSELSTHAQKEGNATQYNCSKKVLQRKSSYTHMP